MASSNKTPRLKLNAWVGTDLPKREDFVTDNALIDQVVGTHNADMAQHLSATDRDKLDSPIYHGSYIGNSAATREIELPFAPSFLILFPMDYPMGKTEFVGQSHYNNFAFCTQHGCSYGVTMTGKILGIANNATPEYSFEIKRFNSSSIMYGFAAFK